MCFLHMNDGIYIRVVRYHYFRALKLIVDCVVSLVCSIIVFAGTESDLPMAVVLNL